MREILRDDVANEHICEFQSSEDLVELGGQYRVRHSKSMERTLRLS